MSRQNGKPNFFDIFVERPAIPVVISLALILLGLRAAVEMPVLEFPEIESSSLVITTPYVGASADTVKGFVTEPIERAAATVPGVDYIDSTTTAGVSTVTAWLNLNEPSNLALAELNTRLGQIRFELPAGAEDPIITVNRADAVNAIFYLDVVMEGRSRSETADYMIRNVVPILSSIPDVQRVRIAGGRDPAMRIWLDPSRLNYLGVSAEQIRLALMANNVIAPIGRIENQQQRIDLQTSATLKTQEDFEQLVIVNIDGAIVRLGEVARIELGEVEGSQIARLSQRDNLFLAVYGLPGANEIEIGNELYTVLDEINATLPDGMHIDIGFDGTVYMRDAIREIFITLAETVLLVGIVVLLFMGSLRSALVPLITIPISLLGAMALMMAMGFSFNLLTILAIVLSVGLVVDDAIVVVENVSRLMREGMSRKQAALTSSRQLLTPIIGMSITLAAVYVPIGFLSGLTGVLIKEFAFTLAVAVLISGMIALTLSPIMSAYASPAKGQEGAMTRWVNARFSSLQRRYEAFLSHSLGWTPQLLGFAIVFSLLSVPFLLMSQQELAPIEDQNEIFVISTPPPEASLEYTHEHMFDVVDVMSNLPSATYMWQIVNPAVAIGGQQFVDPSERDFTTLDMMAETFGRLSKVPGLQAFPNSSPSLPSAGQYSVELVVTAAASAEEMQPYAEKLLAAAYASNLFLFADTNLKIDFPQAHFELNRDRIADVGLTVSGVSQQLSTYLSGNYVNRFDLDGKAYRVIPMLEGSDRLDIYALQDLKIQTPAGELVPFSSLATLVEKVGPRVLTKFQQRNSFTLFAGMIPAYTKEQGLSAIEAAAEEILPSGYIVDYAGESRQIRQEGNTLFGALGMSLAFVFLVLVVLFNRFRDPLVVLLGSVPLALAGALMFTFLGWTTLNIYSQIGLITLIGLVTKNGILIVEFANHLQRQGLTKFDAILQGASVRLRPVLMTTGATVIGHFPLVLVSGAGAEARNSIGIILVAGMLLGTFFTLVVLPSMYLALASKHEAEDVAPVAVD
ncbi:AcrB/AcrD/AcrF family protein [marine gamma proteobacterium HTCC2143]|jgi:multidrug efflux pump|uniref:AcrB/AcrD/AcrF family protein n=1 Tax=marine gamma proteobacterium HTCC2143 TaxID=247633 RepID=A0YDJ0_9GAMM|nr:AcrB/AcrD/AcrF family protein [marine gamma proteobacterium HTCC2143]